MFDGVDKRALLWTGAAVLAATLAAGGVAYTRRRRGRRPCDQTPPTEWRRVGCLEQVVLYPLKSGRGTAAKQAEVTGIGLRTINEDNVLRLRDRIFLVYDEKSGKSCTALQHSKMVLITVAAVGEDSVRFTAPWGDFPDLCVKIPGPEALAHPTTCSMWMMEKVPTADCGDEAAAWLSQTLTGKGSGLRLGYSVDGNHCRSIDNPPGAVFKDYYNKLRVEDYGVYADIASCMLLGSSSVVDLNTRLPADVKQATAAHFRPNFVVQGAPAYEENEWDWIKIGDTAVFRNFKPCTRCHFTTIDPETGVMDLKFKEPLKTLKTYRKLTEPKAVELDGDSPVMGAYLGVHTTGIVHAGDPVYVGVPAA